MSAPFMEVKNISKHFGGVKALDQVSFDINEGDIFGIIGPNGSGKTTLINCLTGFLKPTGGKVIYRGKDITAMAPHKVARLGIARTFQIMRPYFSMPAYKNLVIPLSSPRAKKLGGWRGGGRHGDSNTVAVDILEELGFERDSRVPFKTAGTLPTGYLKRLELGRCLALRPDLIICDEVFSGLSASEIASLIPLLRKLHDQGITLIMVEHRLKELFQLTNRVMALSYGEKLIEGDSGTVIEHPKVREAYLGSEENV